MVEGKGYTENCYKCHQCHRSYKNDESLMRHLGTECGLQPKFQCQYCSYISKRKDNFQRHMKYQHGILDV